MHVVPLVKGPRGGCGVRVEVDRGAEDAAGRVVRRRKLEPPAASRRDERVEARGDAREAVRERRTQLASAREGETRGSLGVIVEDAEDRRERVQSGHEAAADAVQ